MKKALSALLVLVLGISLFTACTKTVEYSVADPDGTTVVSFNVAAPWGSLTNNTLSSSRVKRFASYMNGLKPDIIGTQEMNCIWLDKLKDLMADYDSYAIERGGDENEKKSEMNAVFWRKDKYECIEKGTFWLSETPDTPSRYEGAGCNRICTYVMLRNVQTNEHIFHLNTHLDNAGDEARLFGSQVIQSKIDELSKGFGGYDFEIVITGDFNEYLSGPACNNFASKYNTATVDGNTYHDWGKIDEGEPIDFVFTTAQVAKTVKLDDTTNGLVSDHYGICAVIK